MKTDLKPSDLPIYEEPERVEVQGVEYKRGAYFEAVSNFRKLLWTYLSQVEGTTNTVKNIYYTSKAHSEALYESIKEDRSFLPKAGFITVAALGGVVAGYRNGAIKRTLYASIGGLTATAICYPHDAVALSNRGWQKVRNFSKGIYQSGGASEHKESPAVKELESKAEKVEEGNMASKTIEQNKATKMAIKGDPGMSNPADQDMYTTRDG